MVLVLSTKGALAQRGAESAEAIVRGGAGCRVRPATLMLTPQIVGILS